MNRISFFPIATSLLIVFTVSPLANARTPYINDLVPLEIAVTTTDGSNFAKVKFSSTRSVFTQDPRTLGLLQTAMDANRQVKVYSHDNSGDQWVDYVELTVRNSSLANKITVLKYIDSGCIHNNSDTAIGTEWTSGACSADAMYPFDLKGKLLATIHNQLYLVIQDLVWIGVEAAVQRDLDVTVPAGGTRESNLCQSGNNVPEMANVVID